MEKEANQLYRRPQMTGQARDEEEVVEAGQGLKIFASSSTRN